MEISLFLVVLWGCSPASDEKVIEYYSNGSPEIVVTYSDAQDSFCLAHYYQDGKLHRNSCFMNQEPSGKVVTYYSSGEKRSVENYKRGKREGRAIYYSRKGVGLDTLIYYVRDKKEYRAFYDGYGKRIKENFYYDFNLINDTIQEGKESIEFEVSLMVPDSITKDRKFYFAYELAPLNMKDSIIINPRDSVLLTINDTIRKGIFIGEKIPQILYGHLTFNDSIHIVHNPTDRILYTK